MSKKLEALGKLVDEVWQMAERRKALAREAEEIKASEDVLRAEIKEAMQAGAIQKCAGKNGVAAFRRTVVAQVDDEAVFLKWALLKANRDCLKVGVVSDAFKARREAGVKVPGVTPFVREDLVVNKAGS